MPPIADSILIVILLTNFFILGTANLRAAIRAIAVQGVLLSVLPLFVESHPTLRLIEVVFVTVVVKGVVIPGLLLKAVRDVHIRHEVEPYVGFVPSLFLCAIGTALALLFADNLPLAPADRASLFVPTSLATLLAGFLVLTTRRKAISQVTGYLVLENGVYVFGLLLYQAMVVEVGVLLDLVVGIFVMGIVLNHIQREFSSLDTERLSRLRE
ncbi:MAG TPA: hydrogenase [Thermoanaerobaculia bacterium]|nr:hydrogenase [Thermoanaerobaculia bacterium]